MNMVLQQYGESYYNVWENVCLSNKSNCFAGLSGLYRVHKYHQEKYNTDLSSCAWSYKDLYLVKEIYGGFVDKIVKGVY